MSKIKQQFLILFLKILLHPGGDKLTHLLNLLS